MKLQHLSPILWTNNLEETITFYGDVLRFEVERNFPNFVKVSKDNVELMFIVPEGEKEEASPQKLQLTGSIYIFMEDINQFWELVKNKATIIKSPLCDREYLMRDFSILDNNGYEIVFGQDISKHQN